MGTIITAAEARKNALASANQIEEKRREYFAGDIIDTGDTVKHLPSGETWVVACVHENNLSPVGLLQVWAELSDCVLIKKATAQQKQDLLIQMAAMRNTEDYRCRYAKHVLGRSNP